MSSGAPDQASDVAALRARAHPTRNRILELLQERPSMTATECAGILHLTPKTCSYHLQTLASSGLIEEVSTPGRNRPWQLIADARAPQPAVTSRARKAVRLKREESLLDDAADGVAAAPAEWTEAVTVHTRVATMTADELQAWCDEVERVTTRHVRRSSVPDDSERLGVQLLFCGFPTT